MMMSFSRLALACALAMVVAPAAAFGSGGSGGGGGGGGSTAAACAGPTSVSVANTIGGTIVAPYWQPNGFYYGDVVGRADKTCDNLNVEIRFSDMPLEGDASCAASIPTYRNPKYFKYGIKPPSRFESWFIFATGSDCLGHPHSLTADMIDSITGLDYGSTTITWIPA